MRITVDLTQLVENKLTIPQYLFCWLIYNKDEAFALKWIGTFGKFGYEEIKHLVDNEWLIKDGENYTFKNLHITEKFLIFVEGEKPKEVKKDWIDDWFNLFPKGIKSGGYYVKTDISGCRRKMVKFMEKHPEFTPEIIMKATKNYVDSAARKGYSYMKLAPFFIEKDGISVLSGECEAIADKDTFNYDSEYVKSI